MDISHQLILVGAGLVFISIFAGLISSRVGAPLLLVFLGLGMLAGEDGPGGLDFDDFGTAYTIGATALAIILFDGGLRTTRETLRLATWPSLVLATLGVAITAGLTGAFAVLVLDLSLLEGLLAGSIVASTDAAAVFFLLNLRGTNLVKRVSASLEVESGLNDPMAVFLTVTCVELITGGVPDASWDSIGHFAGDFSLQLAGGAVIGLCGGYILLRLINSLQLAPGLYPVLALSGALLTFGGAQLLGASGFLAVYLAGVVLGTRRHRATQLIERFQDGAAWLCQIVMFLMLGLLVTPSDLVDSGAPALAIAVFLLLIGRPLAVAVCLAPFRFAWREQLFIAWVGLRGAVPIFLGTVPVLAGLPGARLYFEIAFVVVLTSLLVQGWTVTLFARHLNLALPPNPPPPQRVDIDLPEEVGRDMVTYVVQDGSAAASRRLGELQLGEETSIVSVIRDGAMRSAASVGALSPGDHVILITPTERLPVLDRTFARPPRSDRLGRDEAALGNFAFPGDVDLASLARLYEIPIPLASEALTADLFLRRHLKGAPVVGDRLRLGTVELIVRALADDRIVQVGIELEPHPLPYFRKDVIRIWMRHARWLLHARFGA